MRKNVPLAAALGAAFALFLALRRRDIIHSTRSWQKESPGTALVTGASSGIGAAFARVLAREGYDLVLLARREDRLQALAEEITSQHPVQVQVMTIDLADPDQVRQAALRIGELRDLDVLVNNAGFSLGGDYSELDIQSSLDMLQVHLAATMHLTWAALPVMMTRGRGGIINVSSVASFVPGGGSATYGATKAYLNFFTEALAAELHGSGVRVQALCPGFTYTEIHDKVGRPQLPDFLWLDAERVAADSLRGLKAGQLYVIPGRIYQAAVLLARLPFVPVLVRQFRAPFRWDHPAR